MTGLLDTEAILEASEDAEHGEILGSSREGRAIHGHVYGSGTRRVSLIAGCHADEPVGPALLRRLATYLANLPDTADALSQWSWSIVPDANPDGASRNARWIEKTVETIDSLRRESRGYDLASYFLDCVRELPGDDIEFGFPRSESDSAARPENRAIAGFLDRREPIDLHVSLHGMGFAAGPWFLLDRAWIDRTEPMRGNLERQVVAMGYRLHDVDRKGEKGFLRIAEGFTTRPDSRAMIQHFLERDDEATATLFRPSSMEYVRRSGADALTLVSEMPLFLLPTIENRLPGDPPLPADTKTRLEFFAWGRALIENDRGDFFRSEVERLGIRPMPISDQMRLQLAFLEQGLVAVTLEHDR